MPSFLEAAGYSNRLLKKSISKTPFSLMILKSLGSWSSVMVTITISALAKHGLAMQCVQRVVKTTRISQIDLICLSR